LDGYEQQIQQFDQRTDRLSPYVCDNGDKSEPEWASPAFDGVNWFREYVEDQVLKWEDVDWQKHLITVRHEVAKQTSRKMELKESSQRAIIQPAASNPRRLVLQGAGD
jgi:hypothetical protein